MMKLSQLLNVIRPLDLTGPEEVEVTGLSSFSGEVKPGFLFAALKGQKHDGVKFVPEAVDRGALAILSEAKPPDNWPLTWIRVADARESLALMAAEFYGHPSTFMKVIGITGTKGKTTISYLLEAIIARAGGKPGIIGTISYRGPGIYQEALRTTPEAPELQKIMRTFLDNGATHVVLEVSSHSLILKRVMGVHFDIALFTNLSPEHLDFHQTMEDYFEAKKKLFFLNTKKRTAVVNQDDTYGKRLITELPMTTVTFGFEPQALIRAAETRFTEKGTTILIDYPGGEIELVTPLLGRHNVYNILAAFATGLVLNLDVAAIAAGISSLQNVPGRLERIENKLGLSIFVDYAHTEAALKSVLEALHSLNPKRIILVFGCGGDRDRGKRKRMGQVAGELADIVIVTSDNPRSEDPLAIMAEIESGLRLTGNNRYFLEPDRRQAIWQALNLARKGDILLVAGKGHEEYQEIKGKKIPFKDSDVIQDLLKRLEGDS